MPFEHKTQQIFQQKHYHKSSKHTAQNSSIYGQHFPAKINPNFLQTPLFKI
jgi:hypothetical protein